MVGRPGLHLKPHKTLEIRGSPNAVKLAEEFVLAFFTLRDPSNGSDGLDMHPSFMQACFMSEIISKLPFDSILREKIVTFSPKIVTFILQEIRYDVT